MCRPRWWGSPFWRPWGANAWIIHALGAGLLIGRAGHAFGLSRTVEVSPGRMIGILFTWVVLLLTGVLLVIFGRALNEGFGGCGDGALRRHRPFPSR